MTRPIELLPLLCIRCQNAIPADIDEVAWVCGQCGQGLLLDENKGCVAQEIQYSAAIPANSKGHPFWVTDGQVAIAQRRIYGGGDQMRAAQEFWAQPRRFFVPAFTLPLENMVEVGVRFLQNPPAVQPGQPAGFLPVTLHPADIQPMAEFIVMGIEAGRQDKIREVNFTVRAGPPQLWILP